MRDLIPESRLDRAPAPGWHVYNMGKSHG
jgi:hypothetical protein